MISTISESSASHRSGKSIHLNASESDQNFNGSQFSIGNNETEMIPSTEQSSFNAGANNLHPVSHHLHSGRKYQRQRGLSISSGVSYTNFYTRVGKSPNDSQYMFNDSTSRSNNNIESKLKFLKSTNFKIIVLCCAWYISSVLSSNLTKSILRVYRFPVTLTEIQFFLTSVLCFITYCIIYFNRNIAEEFPLGTFPVQLTESRYTTLYQIIKPTRLILTQTIPMGMFQFIGHITSHNATSLISVSMVHTIKALSPIVTVMSYRCLFQVKYPTVTYLTLVPLMLGIMLTCLFKNRSSASSGSLVPEKASVYFKGLVYAFISMLIFVAQNIFAKKILTYKKSLLNSSDDSGYSGTTKHQYTNILPIDKEEETTIKKNYEKNKVDKLTILFYCSIIGFIFTFPIYLSTEFFSNETFSLTQLDFNILSLMLSHSVVHFVQSLLAFHILGLISPVSYSIANIFKRIVVIIAALVWEAQPLNGMQSLGLLLTMVGLYCYDRWGSNKKH